MTGNILPLSFGSRTEFIVELRTTPDDSNQISILPQRIAIPSMEGAEFFTKVQNTLKTIPETKFKISSDGSRVN